jgi:hypothetical protein
MLETPPLEQSYKATLLAVRVFGYGKKWYAATRVGKSLDEQRIEQGDLYSPDTFWP